MIVVYKFIIWSCDCVVPPLVHSIPLSIASWNCVVPIFSTLVQHYVPYIIIFILPPVQVITAKLLFTNVSETSMNSSDNSEDSSEGSPSGHDGPNVEMEKMLPSVVSGVGEN